MRKLVTVLSIALALITLTACGGPPSLTGNWQADDGTGTKVIMSNGMCSGMYYKGPNDPLDIGGPMTCSLSSEKSNNGRYALVVTQSMNQETLYIDFDGDDTAKVYLSGELLFTMRKL